MDRWERVDTADERRRSSAPTGEGVTTPTGAPTGVRRADRTTSRAALLPADVAAAIRKAADTATAHHREVLVAKMADALVAYDRHRFEEALRLARQVAAEAPAVPAVRELAGLAAYRAQRWRDAVRNLQAYFELTEDTSQVPALMDAHRALGKARRVAELWSELRHLSPTADVLSEARIVAAASLADRGDLRGAIDLLTGAGAARSLRNPSDRHLRQWYALADLYERAGDVPAARELFERVARVDPEAYDVVDRLTALGPERPRRTRRRPAVARPTQD
jgi:tetratricopeptide (TPR) repeat protein